MCRRKEARVRFEVAQPAQRKLLAQIWREPLQASDAILTQPVQQNVRKGRAGLSGRSPERRPAMAEVDVERSGGEHLQMLVPSRWCSGHQRNVRCLNVTRT